MTQRSEIYQTVKNFFMPADIIVLYFVCTSACESVGDTCFSVQATFTSLLGNRCGISVLSQFILDSSLGRGGQYFSKFKSREKTLPNFLKVTRNFPSGLYSHQLPSVLSSTAATLHPFPISSDSCALNSCLPGNHRPYLLVIAALAYFLL